VTIYVSSGKPQVTVPDVTGKSTADATNALKAAGFNVTILYQPVNSKKDDGIVLDQHPRGGAKRPQGSNVTIIVGQLAVESRDTKHRTCGARQRRARSRCPQCPQRILKRVALAEKTSRAILTSTTYSVR